MEPSGFMPHGHCYLWKPELVWLHVVADGLIAFSYVAISLTLASFVRRRRDLPFRWMFLAFGLFIVSCGATHALEVWTLWDPRYWFSGTLKAFTAVASIATAALLIPLVPRALALQGPAQLTVANAALRKSEARFRAAVDGMVDEFFLLDAVRADGGAIVDFCIVDANRAASRRMGMAKEALVGSLMSSVAPSATPPLQERLAMYARAVETQKVLEYEVSVPVAGAAGQPTMTLWLSVELVPLDDGVAVRARDITARKRAEELLFQNANDGVCLVSAATDTIVFANALLEAMLGYEPGELTGMEARAQQLECSWLRQRPATYDEQVVTKSGGHVWCRTSLDEMDHPHFGPVWLVTRTNIAERMAAEANVARLASIVASTSDAITSNNSTGIIETWNAGAERLYGYTALEMIGKANATIVPLELQEEERLLLARVAAGERVDVLETIRVHKSGQRVDVSLTASPIQTAGGLTVAVSSIARDISGRKADERNLQASLREKSVLLAEIHHRVKNNLQVVSSMLKLHAEKVTDPGAQRAFEDSQSRVRAIALLHETLYGSKHFGTVDVEDYTKAMVRTHARAHAERGVDVVVRAAGVSLSMDEAMPFGLIVNELLTNSVKHAFSAGTVAAPEVKVTVRKHDQTVELIVADNGVGFPDHFDPGTTTSLGMHLVLALTGQLGGEIAFTTAHGAVATMTFPSTKQGE